MRIATSLPELKARENILKRAITSRDLQLPRLDELNKIVHATVGYSASEIVLIVKDAIVSSNCKSMITKKEESDKDLKYTHPDYVGAITHIKPSISKDIVRLYAAFATRFGCPNNYVTQTQNRYLYLYC